MTVMVADCVPAVAKVGSKETLNDPAPWPAAADTLTHVALAATLHAPASPVICIVRGAGMALPATYWNEIGVMDDTAPAPTLTVKLTGSGLPPTGCVHAESRHTRKLMRPA